jgi:hypothetical protein
VNNNDSSPFCNVRAAAAWSAASAPLAEWALRLLVVRTDVWGGYLPLALRSGSNKSLTKPRTADRGRVTLTRGTLVRHFAARLPEHVAGLHSTSPDSLCRWGAVDIDSHGGTADPAANRRAALGWYTRLAALGFRPLLTGSNGTGGYHLRIIFNRPIPSGRVYALMHWLTGDFAGHGLAARPETFPKQPRLTPGGYGNWLRIPGRHHTTEYRSQVWDGARVLAGAAAVEHILALTGDDPARIPAAVEPSRRPDSNGHVARVLPTARPLPTGGASAAAIRAYAARVGSRGEGERSDAAYQFAAFLTHDLDLSVRDALPWLDEWNSTNIPPLDDDELAAIAAHADAYGTNARGCGLTPPPRRHRRQFQATVWG